MQIKVKLFATLRVGRFNVEYRDYPPGSTVGQITEELDIPEKELGIVFVNGRHAAVDQLLKEGDTLSFFPLVGGG
jgi:molybdopterin converting factor small subunit